MTVSANICRFSISIASYPFARAYKFTTAKGIMPVFGVKLADMSGTPMGIGSSNKPLLFVKRIAIAEPLASVTVIAVSSMGSCALLA